MALDDSNTCVFDQRTEQRTPRAEVERFAIRDLDATLVHLNDHALGAALVIDGNGFAVDVVANVGADEPVPYALGDAPAEFGSGVFEAVRQ